MHSCHLSQFIPTFSRFFSLSLIIAALFVGQTASGQGFDAFQPDAPGQAPAVVPGAVPVAPGVAPAVPGAVPAPGGVAPAAPGAAPVAPVVATPTVRVEEWDGKMNPQGQRNPSPLRTLDGVDIALSYYPSNLSGRALLNAVPIILLHDLGGSRKDLAPLAAYLQTRGFAVIVPDLRGHGNSSPIPNIPDIKRINAAQGRGVFYSMVTQDMEAIRREMLWKKSNLGQFNTENTVVVGVGMGSTIGLWWSRLNWSTLPIGISRLGQDVKALILLSPSLRKTPGFVASPFDLKQGLPTPIVPMSRGWQPYIKPVQGPNKQWGPVPLQVPTPLSFERELRVAIFHGSGGSEEALSKNWEKFFESAQVGGGPQIAPGGKRNPRWRAQYDQVTRRPLNSAKEGLALLPLKVQIGKAPNTRSITVQEYIGSFIHSVIVPVGFPPPSPNPPGKANPR